MRKQQWVWMPLEERLSVYLKRALARVCCDEAPLCDKAALW